MTLDLPGLIDDDPVGELDLSQRLAIDAVLGFGVPGPRDLMVVEDAEFHDDCSAWGVGASLR
jgi:hypothetical protein